MVKNGAKMPLVDDTKAIWSIGIYEGRSISALEPAIGAVNPVITAENVLDLRARFVADPFMIKIDDIWYMFFEVMSAEADKGKIGLAVSKNGFQWDYRQIVLDEPFHLSYPHVFHLDGNFYMIPESHEADSLRLYRADEFPAKWSLVSTLLKGPWIDSSILFFDNLWWLFTNIVVSGIESLELFYAGDITGSWHRHPMSPLIKGDLRTSRMAGRVVINRGLPVRFAQDGIPYYGTSVRAFEVSSLNTWFYAERELHERPVLAAGEPAWHKLGMHHIDLHFANGGWLACVDGWRVETTCHAECEA
ncbi:MAG TPA: hypothetical protein VG488_10980 [Candidatus Angelobacter sp.]|nr:hypothetical protein [Candidatus Angelobacter sp.]